jgi:hypothetical protein
MPASIAKGSGSGGGIGIHHDLCAASGETFSSIDATRKAGNAGVSLPAD